MYLSPINTLLNSISVSSQKNDFFYFDPPYLITTGNYNDGNRGFQNWTEAQELELLKLMDTLTSHGIKICLK